MPDTRLQTLSVATLRIPFALLLTLAGACGTTQLTPQQEWVMALFAECKTRTNAINVKLEQVRPDGSWTASSMQTQSDYNHVVECMQDETVSASLYRRQADSGNAAAMAYLGRMYEYGRGGLPKDDAEAVQWYRRGAEAGNGQAMASLAYMYERGRGGLSKDLDEAGHWYRKGAGAGDRFAMYFMGRAQEFGLGVPKDRARENEIDNVAASVGAVRAGVETISTAVVDVLGALKATAEKVDHVGRWTTVVDGHLGTVDARGQQLLRYQQYSEQTSWWRFYLSCERARRQNVLSAGMAGQPSVPDGPCPPLVESR